MKKRINTELILQILILFVCLLTMAFLSKSIFVKAQTSCTQPPFYSEYYRTDWRLTERGSWAQGSQVKITVDKLWNDFDRGQLDQGVKLWGGTVATQTYSNVSFESKVSRQFDDYNVEAPQDEIWIQKTMPSRNDGRPAECDYTYNTAGRVKGANIRVRPDVVNDSYNLFVFIGTHEAGHTFGIFNCTDTCTASIMRHAMYQNAAWNGGGPKSCDIEKVKRIYAPPSCSNYVSQNNNDSCPSGYTPDPTGARYCCPTPTPTPTPIIYYPPPEGCYRPIDNFSGGSCSTGFASDAEGGYCCQGNDCREMEQQCLSQGGYWGGCADGCYSPIVIDILGNGYNLTDGENGIEFDLTGKGSKHKISWTSVNSDDAWLVLDRNENGRIDSGLELFGNFTVQDSSISVKDRNGFLALAVFDKPENGGNRDGVINKSDTIFTSLQLWQDKNHNGISESNELHTLSSLDIETLELDYRESRRTDEHGNRFKYRAKVWDANKAKVGRWAWDVFLLKGN